METSKHRQPTAAEAYICVIASFAIILMMMFLGLKVHIAMLLASIIAFIFALRMGYSWAEIEKAISDRLGQLAPTLCIMWLIGMFLGAMMFSGTLPLLVKWGFQIISPKYLYVSALLVCSVMSMTTGSSWTSVATGGVACMTICQMMGGNTAIMAAAVISGAIFGDKISPMSETTNLAPACTGNDLWSHIHAQLYTTIPAYLIAVVFYLILGFKNTVDASATSEAATAIINQLGEIYNLNPILVLPVVLMIILAVMKKPAIPSLLVCSFLAIFLGVFVQGPAFTLTLGTTAAISGFTVSSVAPEGMEVLFEVSKILNRGGMTSMANVVMICYCGFSMTTIMIRTGILDKAVEPLMKRANSRVSTVLTAEIAIFVVHAIAGISYLSSVFVGEAWRKQYVKNGLGLPALSRTLEDVGTTVSCLFPWGQSGAYYVATLGVGIYGAGGYAPFLTLSYLCPIIALVLAAANIGMFNLTPEQQKIELEKIEAMEGNRKTIAELDQ